MGEWENGRKGEWEKERRKTQGAERKEEIRQPGNIVQELATQKEKPPSMTKGAGYYVEM